MRRLLYILPVALIALLAALFALLLSSPRDPAEIPSPLISRPVPAFELPSLMGEGTVSEADLKGRVTLLNVFASWCVPCRVEHPQLMRIAREGSAQVIGLNYKDKPADAKQWLADLGNPYAKIAADAKGRAAIDFGVYGVPETFLIDAAGRIRLKHTGPIHPSDYTDKIAPAIAALAKEGGGE